jgi:hypothetical protein
MTTCTTWVTILKAHESGEWFNNVAYSIYSYAHPGTKLARKDWWNQCELKVRAFINLQIKTFWNSSIQQTCELLWDEILIILPESLCGTCAIYTTPKRRPPRRRQNNGLLPSVTVIKMVKSSRIRGKKRKVGTMPNGEETPDKRPSKKLKLHKT